MALLDPGLAAPSLRLRPWRTADAPALSAGWADPAVASSTAVPTVASAEAAGRWIGGWDARAAAGSALDLVIAPPSGPDEVWGEVGLAPIDWRRATAEVGYWVAPAQRGRGLATTAVDLLVTWALVALPLDRVVARVTPGAAASARVVAKAGFSRRGRTASGHDLWARAE